jgi:hypothetical protein
MRARPIVRRHHIYWGTMLDQSRARFKKMHPARAGCKVLSIVDQAET